MEEIKKFYTEDCNESQRLISQSGQIEYITTMKYLKMYCRQNMSVLDACAGCGIYSFPLADLGCNVIAGDLIDKNVAHIRKENERNQKLKDIYQGSVLDLSRFNDNSFDVVLNLGSYYHLCDEADREKSLSETLRVLKNGGIYIIAYVNRCANYMAHFEELKDNYSFLVNYMKEGHIENSTLFYSTTPEMIEEDLKKYNLKLLHHVATDGPIFIYREIVENMSQKDFNAFMDIHLSLCDKRSNLGYSEHGLIVAQKVNELKNELDSQFLKSWMKGFEKGLNSLDEANKTCLLKECARSCANTGVLEKHQKLYEAVNHNLDEYYRRINETGDVTGEVIISGKEYMITYPECGCDLHTSCGLNSGSLCECSRQSILYVEQSVTNKTINVERLESVLDGNEVCKFRIRFEDL